MSFGSWLLALHVLGAFALVAGIIFFWVVILAVRRIDSADETVRMAALSRFAEGAIAIGMGGTIVLGIWLAFSFGGYEIWDGWIVAAVVLWLITANLGQRTSAAYARGVKKAKELQAAGQTGPSSELLALNRASTLIVLQLVVSVVVLLVLIDMIWKPGT